MRVPVKLIGLVFWLFFFNCGQCQECLPEDIQYENTEPVTKALYNDGETVKVNCMTGFTGMYRLKCDKGTWKRVIERPCAKRKCSHPGDIANGDFKIIVGSEFVFGATVLYTCKKGFEMTSRINQRTCRAQGWDNTVPVCEAMKCPAIHTNADVTASGNTEEGSYGDVIHFECVSSDKKIDGSSDIHCKETGEWSDSVPTCKEITCTAPAISNGFVVEQVQVYQRDAILKYKCLQGFKPRLGIPRCAKFGWTLNPECDEVTCELKSNRFGIKNIDQEGKTIFRAGESVEITCTERYWIFGTKETIKSFTCQENGKWDHEPVCENIRCEVPRDQHVSYPEFYFWGDIKVGARKSYYCLDGYEQKAAVATCTLDGWTPKPLCAAKQKLCPDLSVENGLIHSHSSKEEEIFYTCNTGYKPFSGKWWDSVTCSKGSWSGEPRCIRKEECGAFPSVHHGKLKQTKQIFQDGDRIAFECDPGFIPAQHLIKCVSGTWETPVCIVDVRCDIPPKVENAFITSKPEEFYVDGSSVTYVCGSSSLMNEKSTVFCRSGIWEQVPTCKEVMCVANLTVNMRSDITADEHTGLEVSVRSGQTITLSCVGKGVKLQGRNKITCLSNGQWDIPFPKCLKALPSGKCGPPPHVDFADTIEMTKDEYDSGKKVEYSCFNIFTLVQRPPYSKYLTCDQGEWRGNIKCLKPCSVSVEEMDERGIELRWRGLEKIFSPHGDRISFRCKRGKSSVGSDLIQTCNDGVMNLPLCE